MQSLLFRFVRRMGFSTDFKGCLCAFLSALYIGVYGMQPFGYWYNNLVDRAFNCKRLRSRLQKIIPGLPSWHDFSREEAIKLRQYFLGLPLIDFFCYSDSTYIAEGILSVLQPACRDDFSVLLHLFSILRVGDEGTYESYRSLFVENCKALENMHIDYEPLPAKTYEMLKRCLAGYAVMADSVVPASAHQMISDLEKMAGDKERKMELYLTHYSANQDRNIKIDFARALYPVFEDSIESSLVFGGLFCRKLKNYLLVNPSFSMLRILCDSLLGSGCTGSKFSVVVVCTEGIRNDHYAKIFPEFTFLSFDHFVSDSAGCKKFEAAYLNVTHLRKGKLVELIEALQNQCCDGCSCNFLISSTQKSELVQAQMTEWANYSVNSIGILPHDISPIPPAKKYLVKIDVGEKNGKDILLRNIEHEKSGKMRLARYGSAVSIGKHEWISERSIDLLESQPNAFMPAKQYKKRDAIFYSREICVYFRKYVNNDGSYRVIAFMRFPKSTKKESMKTDRTTKKEKRFRCNEEELFNQIRNWVETEYLRVPEIRTQIRKNLTVRSIKQEGTVSLRTFWFLEFGPDVSGSDGDAMMELAADEGIGNLMLGEDSKDAYEEALGLLEKNKTDENLEIVWRSLGILLNKAVEKGILTENPLGASLNQRINERKSLAQVRSGLAKRNLSIPEMRKTIEILDREGKSPYALAAKTRFFTGMSPRELVVLRVSDVVRNPKAKTTCIVVRAMEADNINDIASPKTIEQCRQLPLISAVADELWEWCKDKEDSDFVFYDEEKHRRIFSREIATYCRNILRRVLPNSDFIEILKNSGDEITTDLMSYKGDFFRSNYQYALREFCQMNDGERNYLLGVKQHITFAKNYKDFQKFFVIKSMAVKLERWYAMVFLEPVNAGSERIERIVVKETCSERVCISLDFDLLDGDEIEICCTKGISGYVIGTEKEGNRNEEDRT